jgi:uncharacterized membrane protein
MTPREINDSVGVRIGTFITAISLLLCVCLFLIPCIVARIIISGVRIAWFVADDILGPLESGKENQ